MKKDVAEVILKHVEILSKRPGMFIHDVSFTNVTVHLDGYFQALFDTKQIEVRNSWPYWVSLKYKKWGPKWSWKEILLERYESESIALQVLPSLIVDYLKDAQNNGERSIEDMHSRQF